MSDRSMVCVIPIRHYGGAYIVLGSKKRVPILTWRGHRQIGVMGAQGANINDRELAALAAEVAMLRLAALGGYQV